MLHVVPVYPGAHVHVPAVLLHDPPFRQPYEPPAVHPRVLKFKKVILKKSKRKFYLDKNR